MENCRVVSLIQMHQLPSERACAMQAVNLCSNKIIQFLTGSAGYHRLTCIVAVKMSAAGGFKVQHKFSTASRADSTTSQDFQELESFPSMSKALKLSLLNSRTFSNKWQASHQTMSNLLMAIFTSCQILINLRWRFGVVVTRWSRSTRLTYAEPG